VVTAIREEEGYVPEDICRVPGNQEDCPDADPGLELAEHGEAGEEGRAADIPELREAGGRELWDLDLAELGRASVEEFLEENMPALRVAGGRELEPAELARASVEEFLEENMPELRAAGGRELWEQELGELGRASVEEFLETDIPVILVAGEDELREMASSEPREAGDEGFRGMGLEVPEEAICFGILEMSQRELGEAGANGDGCQETGPAKLSLVSMEEAEPACPEGGTVEKLWEVPEEFPRTRTGLRQAGPKEGFMDTPLSGDLPPRACPGFREVSWPQAGEEDGLGVSGEQDGSLAIPYPPLPEAANGDLAPRDSRYGSEARQLVLVTVASRETESVKSVMSHGAERTVQADMAAMPETSFGGGIRWNLAASGGFGASVGLEVPETVPDGGNFGPPWPSSVRDSSVPAEASSVPYNFTDKESFRIIDCTTGQEAPVFTGSFMDREASEIADSFTFRDPSEAEDISEFREASGDTENVMALGSSWPGVAGTSGDREFGGREGAVDPFPRLSMTADSTGDNGGCFALNPGDHGGDTLFGNVVASGDGNHGLVFTDASGTTVGASDLCGRRVTAKGVWAALAEFRKLSGARRIIPVGAPGRGVSRGGLRGVSETEKLSLTDAQVERKVVDRAFLERLEAGGTLPLSPAGKGRLGEFVVRCPSCGSVRSASFSEALDETLNLVTGGDGIRPVGMRTASRQVAIASGWKGMERYFEMTEGPDGKSGWKCLEEEVRRKRMALDMCVFTATSNTSSLAPDLAGSAFLNFLEIRKWAAGLEGNITALVADALAGTEGDFDQADDSVAEEAEPFAMDGAAGEAGPSQEARAAGEAELSREARAAGEAELSREARAAGDAELSREARAAGEAGPSPEARAAGEAGPSQEARAAGEAGPSQEAMAAGEAELSREASAAGEAENSTLALAAE
jgi:hypothetical protein